MTYHQGKRLFMDMVWIFEHANIVMQRKADELNVGFNLHRPVSDLRGVPVSGDHLRHAAQSQDCERQSNWYTRSTR